MVFLPLLLVIFFVDRLQTLGRETERPPPERRIAIIATELGLVLLGLCVLVDLIW